MPDGNGGPLAGLRGFIEEIDHYDDELAALKSDYSEKCKAPRAAIAEIKQRAKDNDYDMAAFDCVLREHRDIRAGMRRLADLDLASRSHYEAMIVALGDYGSTPLGSAALGKAKPEKHTGL